MQSEPKSPRNSRAKGESDATLLSPRSATPPARTRPSPQPKRKRSVSAIEPSSENHGDDENDDLDASQTHSLLDPRSISPMATLRSVPVKSGDTDSKLEHQLLAAFGLPLGLPYEVWGNVVAFMDIKNVVTMSMASTFWCAFIWRFVFKINTKALSTRKKHRASTLILRVAKQQRSHSIPYGVPYALRELKIDCERLETADEGLILFHYATRFTNLNKLHLSGLGLGRVDLNVSQFKELCSLSSITSLDIGGYHRTSQVLPDIVKFFPELRKLYLRESARRRNIPDLVDDHLALIATLTSLRTLHLNGFGSLTPAGTDHLTSLSHLDELSLTDSSATTPGLATLGTILTNLKSLRITDDYYRFHECALIYITGLTKLSLLYYTHGYSMTDSSLELLSHFEHLTRLSLSCCPKITGVGLTKGLGHMPSLKVLSLRWCPELATLKGLSHLETVRDLDLGGCFMLGDAELQHISKLHLKKLNLGRVERLTERGIGFVALISTLTRLSFPGCTLLRDADVLRLTTLTNLKSINITGCSGISTHWTLLPWIKRDLFGGRLPNTKVTSDRPERVDLSDYLFKRRLSVSGL